MDKFNQDYARAAVFGIEDSLVSTTGVIAGVSAGTGEARVVLLAGIVAVVVEATSMAAGYFLSERTVHQIAKTKQQDSLAVGAFIMFLAYSSGGLIPIIPLILLPYPGSVFYCVGAALAGLFTLGFVKGRLLKVGATRSAIEMVAIGGVATALGIVAGVWLKV